MAENSDMAEVEGGATPEPRPGRRFPVRGALIAVAIVVVVALVLPVFSTLQPAYYERYPSLRVRMENWRKSTHALEGCADCHVDPGFTGFATFAAKSIPDFYSQLIYGPRATNLLAVPSSAACLKCHTTYRTVSPNGDLLIPHRAHVVVLQIKCAVCHKNLVHSLNPLGFNTPVMATCMTCHDGKQATAECVKCHTRKQVPANHKQPDWLTVHSTKVGTIDCAQCHGFTPDFCQACHQQRPASHAGNFKQTHPARIALLGVKSCYICHDAQKFCKQCH
jgi:hypothetical protein